MGFGWYYDWQTKPLWDNPHDATTPQVDFVPITWGKSDVSTTILEQIKASGENTLLTFNEPDNLSQSNLSVDEALALWPALMNTGMRLGSPATTTEQTLGENSWLNEFMQGVETKGYNVDFMAVHYYSDNPDVGAFKDYLAEVYDTYKLPIWVTEWALVDWSNPDRFLLSDTAKFASEAIQMLDDLDYVERHAWFAAYEGGDNWYINTEVFDDAGHLTPVGDVFAQMLGTAGNFTDDDMFA